jgi:hypothetical protein
VTDERRYRTLLHASAGTAVVCIVELLWLRGADFAAVRSLAPWLFLPWLAAAAVNLALWHAILTRGRGTFLNRLGFGAFWVTSAAFATAFAALYGLLLFGWV